MMWKKNERNEDEIIKDSRQIALARAKEMTAEEPKVTAPETKEKAAEDIEAIKEKANLADNYYDQLLRLKAEFENYRKRMNKEKEEYQEILSQEIIYALLTIIDNFERAVKAAEGNKSFERLFEGLKLIHKQINEFLGRYGVTAIESQGKKFNPAFHEAVAHEESDSHEEDTVMEEVLRGYAFKDKVLRPAIVKVVKKKLGQEEKAEGKK